MSSRKPLSMAARYAEKKQDVPRKETRTIIGSIESKRYCRISGNDDKKHKDEVSWEDSFLCSMLQRNAHLNNAKT